MSSVKRRINRVGRGTLTVIACLLIGSALVRVTGGAGEAWAKAEEQFSAQPSSPGQIAPRGAAECMVEDDLEAMLAALSDRETRLKQREEKVRKRIDALAMADREISARMQELQKIEEDLGRTLAIADQAAEKDIGKLVSVYENMKSKDAAALFEEMDPNFAAGFLARMQPEAAAGVMAGLSPTAAYTISVVLAGRNAEAPKD